MVYYSTLSSIRSAWHSLAPSAAREIGRKIPTRVSESVRQRSRPLVSKYVNKRAYCTPTHKSWTEASKEARVGPISFVWLNTRRAGGLLTLIMNAAGVWFLHSELHKEHPTWVSYMAFVPMLDWIPMLDIAGLPRPLVLIPAAAIAAAVFFGIPRIPIFGLLYVLPILSLEMYRNYHILSHFEQMNWSSLLFWSVFRTEWVFVSILSILGYQRYQLVPHEQSTLGQTMKQVKQRLDESLENEAIIDSYNVPFIVFNWFWKNGGKFAVEYTSDVIESAGVVDKWNRAVAWVKSATSSPVTSPTKGKEE